MFADFLLLVELGDLDGLIAEGLAGAHFAELGGAGHLDGLFPLRLGDADLAVLFLDGNVDLGLLHGLGGRLAANGLDVARFIRDVSDVDVDQDQADLL